MNKRLLKEFDTNESDSIEDIIIDKVSGRDIAVIGMAVKLPKAENIDEFWRILEDGIDCVRKIPLQRKHDLAEYLNFTKETDGSHEYAEGGYLDDIDKFDYGFFGISPKEASLMDPNQRLFLEAVWKAIEDAGYSEKRIRGSKTGVFVGFSGEGEYKRMVYAVEPSNINIALTGNLPPVIASRISYLLDLHGPNMLVNTVCSSSLVAVHLACQSILAMESEIAIAAGVQTHILPIRHSYVGIESSDGRTKAFDDRSDGTGSGEGIGIVVLKKLSTALKDGDNIYAVIKGTAINQDGNTIGISAPNPSAQEEVIVQAWTEAGIDPESITYIEAHGTGTKLGDPIELEGIRRAFRRYTDKNQFCAIGTVKTNLGHLDSTAGIAGLIKAVLCLKHKKIAASNHFEIPNRKIDFCNSPVYVCDKTIHWEERFPRRCGVSSFGFSGTNCHVVLEEAPEVKLPLNQQDSINILTISAKSQEAFAELFESYKLYLKNQQDKHLRNICYTANIGRGHYKYRLAIISNSIEELNKKIESISSFDADICRDGIYFGKHEINLKGFGRRSGHSFTEAEIAEFSRLSKK